VASPAATSSSKARIAGSAATAGSIASAIAGPRGAGGASPKGPIVTPRSRSRALARSAYHDSGQRPTMRR
jgi:hypothetical protein